MASHSLSCGCRYRHSVALDTLCGYVWPDPASPEAMKKRRQTARTALAELAAVGWTVSEYAKGKWDVKRPASPPPC